MSIHGINLNLNKIGNFGLSKIEIDMYPDIGPFDFLKNKLDAELKRNQKFEFGGSVWERIPKDGFMKIGKIIAEMDASIPYEEKMERVAFKIIGENYIEDLEERDRFFEENPDKTLECMEACLDAEYVYSDLLGGLPDLEMPIGHASSTTHNVGEKTKLPLWKKVLAGGLIAVTGLTALGAYLTQVYIPQQKRNQRMAQLKEVGLSEDQPSSFDDSYSRYAQDDWLNSAYNQTILNFAKAGAGNQLLADEGFDAFENFKDPIDFIKFVNRTGYDGLSLLQKYPQLAREVLPLYLELGNELQKPSQINTVNNATLYFGSTAALKNEIGNEALLAALRTLGENDGINNDFNSSRLHANLLRLAKYVQNILKYPKDWKEGSVEVDEIVYKNGFDRVNGEGYVWEKFIKPAVSFILGQRENGNITAPGGEIDLIHANLLDVDIKTGYRLKVEEYTLKNRLAMGVRNVNPDDSGKLPLEWLFDLAYRHYTNRTKTIDWCDEKWSPYDIALYRAYGVGEDKEGLALNWPNCAARYVADLDKIKAEQGDLIPFIIGEPYFLIGYFPEPIVPNMIEQTTPYYTTLVAYTFGVKSRVAGAVYPSDPYRYWHNEPTFYLNGKPFSFFGYGDYSAFKGDYVSKVNKPEMQITGTDGKFIDVDLES